MKATTFGALINFSLVVHAHDVNSYKIESNLMLQYYLTIKCTLEMYNVCGNRYNMFVLWAQKISLAQNQSM